MLDNSGGGIALSERWIAGFARAEIGGLLVPARCQCCVKIGQLDYFCHGSILHRMRKSRLFGMKKLIPLFAGLILAGCSLAQPANPDHTAENPDPNHTHADFAVFIRGQEWDFAAAKYQSDHIDDSDTAEPEHVEVSDHHKDPYLHLHDGVGTVVHRHKPGLTLLDFFRSLGWTWDAASRCFVPDTGTPICDSANEKWRLVINGAEQPFELNYAFADLDKLLLSFDSPVADLSGQIAHLTDDACLYSRTCPQRGTPPVENCVADPDVPCVVPVSAR